MIQGMPQNSTQFEEKKIDEEVQDLAKNLSTAESESDKEESNANAKLGSIANTLIDVTQNDSKSIET